MNDVITRCGASTVVVIHVVIENVTQILWKWFSFKGYDRGGDEDQTQGVLVVLNGMNLGESFVRNHPKVPS